MNPESVPGNRKLIRDVVILQFKLLLDALRDIALSPLTLAAAALDLLFSRSQSPRYFYAVLKLGERSEEWIDLWAAARGAGATDRENVDALLARVEEVVSDPGVGARRARVLKRWAERQMAKARKQVEADKTRSIPAPEKRQQERD